MPGEVKKELYIGSSLQELNKKVDLNLTKGLSSRMYAKSAGKMLLEAEKAYKSLDEERAYVMFMKYIALWQATKKSKDYKENKDYVDALLGTTECTKAISRAEELSSSLIMRYEEQQNQEASKRLEEDKTKVNGSRGEETNGGVENGETEEVKPEKRVLGDSGLVNSIELYKELEGEPNSILIMDVRRSDHFKDSHMTVGQCVSIPAEILRPGMTASTLEKGLGEEANALWSQRTQMEFLVLVDWDDSLASESSLAVMKDTICKWDWGTKYKNDPLILKGGYEDWLLKYPMFTSNPRAKKPAKKVDEPKNLLDFDYPVFEEEKPPPPPLQPQPAKVTPAGNKSNQAGPLENGNGTVHNRMFFISGQPMKSPYVDRTVKPGAANPDPRSFVRDQADSQKYSSPNSAPVPNAIPEGKISSSTTNQVAPPELAQNGTVCTPKPPAMPVVDRNLKPKLPSGPTIEMVNRVISNDSIADKVTINKPKTEDAEIRSAKSSEPASSTPNEKEKKEEEEEEETATATAAPAEEEEIKSDAKMEDLKKKEEQARQNLHKMRYDKTKAENEKLKVEKAEMEKNLLKLEQELARQRKKTPAKPSSPSHTFAPSPLAPNDEGESHASVPSTSVSARNNRGMDTVASPEQLRAHKTVPNMDTKAAQPNQNSNAITGNGPSASTAAAGASPPATRALPAGWEKRWDNRSQRYLYVNHNDNTMLGHPPDAAPNRATEVDAKSAIGGANTTSVKPPAERPSTAISGQTTRKPLKSDTSESSSKSSGLKRSFSSPNIAQMVMNEGALPFNRPSPSVDRSSKPVERTPQTLQQFKSPYLSRVPNLNPIFGNQGRALTGLRNLGNTCFMNSVIQCLSNTTPLAKYFITDAYLADINRENPLGRGGEVAEEFAIVVKAIWSGQYRSVAPRDLRDTITKYVPEFRKHIGHHHDSQEFLLFLLDGLHEDLNEVKKREYIKEEDFSKFPDRKAASLSWQNHERLNRSIIVSLFQGQFKSTVECLSCHNKSVKFEAFMYLSLPIPSNSKCTLNDCLVRFSQPEKLSGDNATHCSHCKANRNSKKTILIWRLPKILLIHLKRFYYEGMWRQKLQTFVDFPIQDFNMERFVIGPSPVGAYQVYGVSNHTGTLDGGHYTAYCQNSTNRKWYKYDDHEVYCVSQNSIKSSAAYILFYSSIQLSPP